MPRNVLLALAMLLPFLATAAPAAAAQPVAVATADVNLRAGPGTQFPVVAIVPHGGSVVVYGCLTGFTWCDVSWGNDRGWVAAAYLNVVYAGRPVVLDAVVAPRLGVTVVVFDQGYWVRHYPGRPWFRRWAFYATR